MALPKEPRQKMINMMYLVLTALLALNVSSEILNAFKTVNTSITTSNNMIDAKNDLTYKSFENKLKDPQTKDNAAKWQPKALKAKALSAEMFGYIEGLKKKLKEYSGLKEKDGKEEFKEDNLDAATRLMDKEGEGKKLYDKLAGFKSQMLAILNPAEFANEPVLQAEIKKAREDFQKSLPINLDVPKSQSGKEYSNDAQGWTTNYFHMTPTVAGLTILSKFQNDVKNSESQMVDYFHKKIGEVVIVYDKFQAIAQANTSYAMPGDKIQVTAGVGAFSAAAKPTIFINGQNVQLGADGTASWETVAAGEGNKSINVVIEYSKPDGTREKITKEVKYEVARPAGVAVSPTKMNVLYIGVENPLQITAGVGSEKINASFTGGEIHRVSGNNWVANPKTPGEQKINVIIDGKATPVLFRVKKLPDPFAYCGGSRGGRIAAATLKAQGGIIARLDSDFEAPFKVVSYTVGAVGGKISLYQQQPNQGNRWAGAAAQLIESCGPGTAVFFDNIKVQGPDGAIRDLPQMSFILN